MLANTTREVDWIPSSVVLNAFPTGVAICDEKGIICQSNAELSRLFGFHEFELIGHPIECLIPEGLKEKYHSKLFAFLENPNNEGPGMMKELCGLRADGTTIPVEVGLNPIDTPFGCRIITTITDISPRHNMIHNLKKIIDSAPVGMMIIDQSGAIKHSNQHLLKLFDYSDGELEGMSLTSLIPIPNQHHLQQYDKDCMHYGSIQDTGVELNLIGLSKLDQEIPLEIGLNPVEIDGSSLIIVTIKDVTERTKIEMQLRKQRVAVEQFSQMVANDIRVPLNDINKLIEWAEEDLQQEPANETAGNLDRVHARINQIEKLLKDLYSYTNKQQQPLPVESLSLQQVLTKVVDFINPLAGFKIEFSGYLENIQSPTVPLEAVLRNTLNNIIEQHDDIEGNINVIVAIDGPYCQFDIEISGPTVSSNYTITGQPLNQQLIELHGGKVEPQTEEEKSGNRVRFWWPRNSTLTTK